MNKSGLPQKRFPFRLHDLLDDCEANGADHIISWMPCGTLFKIHKHKEFTRTIMPKYCRHSRYKSFLRQLSMYKFQRINEGPNRGCYHHPNFQRGRFDLIEVINRKERDGPGDYAPNSSTTTTTNTTPTATSISTATSSTSGLMLNKVGLIDVPHHLPNADALMSMQDIINTNDDSMLMIPLKGEEDFELVDFDDDMKNTENKPSFMRTTTLSTITPQSQSLSNLMKDFYMHAFPMSNTPDDIVQEIISTFRDNNTTKVGTSTFTTTTGRPMMMMRDWGFSGDQ